MIILWTVWRTGWAWIICGAAGAICKICADWGCGLWMNWNDCGCWITCTGWGCWITCTCWGCWMIWNGWDWGWGCWTRKLVVRCRAELGRLITDGVDVAAADKELKTGIWLITVGCTVVGTLSRQTNCCGAGDGDTACWIILLFDDVQRKSCWLGSVQ